MKYALVTGGNRGIGRAICKRLAADGYYVLINYKSNVDAANETLDDIQNAGGHAELLPFDVSDRMAATTALNGWLSQHEGALIEVLVNNAGIRNDALMVFMEDLQWDQVIDTSLNGFYNVTKAVLQPMLLARKGRIINIASLSGISGLAGQTNYSAAKAALIGATRALAKEIAPRKITVNAVAPGFIDTDMTKDLMTADIKKQIPMGRMGQAHEVAALVSFLASEEASYITGQVIAIAGGLA